jgi:hypothetical protein
MSVEFAAGEMTTGRKLNNVASLRQGTSLSRGMPYYTLPQ